MIKAKQREYKVHVRDRLKEKALDSQEIAALSESLENDNIINIAI
jgi:hypothetical protein